MLVSSFMGNLSSNTARLMELQNQLSSGKKSASISDDPVSLIYSQQARQRLQRLEMYQKNIQTTGEWLTQTESALSDLNEVIKSAMEACVTAANDIENAGDRQNTAEYIAQLRDHFLNTLNSTYGTKFVFGGYDTTGYTNANGEKANPFTVNAAGDLLFNGEEVTPAPGTTTNLGNIRDDVLTFDLGLGVEMEATMNGVDVAVYNGDENIYGLLSDLFDELSGDSPDAETISGFISKFQDAQEHILGLTAELGGRQNRLEMLENRYSMDEINYTQMKSDAEDADIAEVIMNLKMAEAVYNAALAAGANIIQPTLMDFLR
jgi:flagellar hook-associated protein 3 FlgL